MRTYSINPRHDDDDGMTIWGDLAFLGCILVGMVAAIALIVGVIA
ncbi:hypothetical protein [Pseudomonas phage Nerthus]|uniref:Uncharacterized protein n=1 Tax=Pseudomonas phage Nerthus TaxID=2163984 RepID=A0A2S1GMN5_9CAUD|nr:hypothetical protein HOT09_gp02 [Pseudomonas phage Nerthus]AWD90634.1 hypothetical protein [Pseudomonas phage Nerthus]